MVTSAGINRFCVGCLDNLRGIPWSSDFTVWSIYRYSTPRKTNMSPENQWLEDVFLLEIVPFWGTCSFSGVYIRCLLAAWEASVCLKNINVVHDHDQTKRCQPWLDKWTINHSVIHLKDLSINQVTNVHLESMATSCNRLWFSLFVKFGFLGQGTTKRPRLNNFGPAAMRQL